MMRILLSLALLVTATPLFSQEAISGIAIDSMTRGPLRCVDVMLRDTADNVLARTQTSTDGSFRFEPRPGPHLLEFAVWRRTPARRAILPTAGPDGQPRAYALTFEAALTLPLALWPDTVDSPPGHPLEVPRLRNLGQLARRGEAAVAVVRYAVDLTGRVDRSSIQVLESSHKAWEQSVVAFLREVRYEPARRNGQPVCALEYGKPFNFNAHP